MNVAALSVSKELSLGHSQKNPILNQANVAGAHTQTHTHTHTQWTYGQSSIVCCAIYGSVVCHLFCLSETRMTPVWILNKRLFLRQEEGCCHLISLNVTHDWRRFSHKADNNISFSFVAVYGCVPNGSRVTFQRSNISEVLKHTSPSGQELK